MGSSVSAFTLRIANLNPLTGLIRQEEEARRTLRNVRKIEKKARTEAPARLVFQMSALALAAPIEKRKAVATRCIGSVKTAPGPFTKASREWRAAFKLGRWANPPSIRGSGGIATHRGKVLADVNRRLARCTAEAQRLALFAEVV